MATQSPGFPDFTGDLRYEEALGGWSRTGAEHAVLLLEAVREECPDAFGDLEELAKALAVDMAAQSDELGIPPLAPRKLAAGARTFAEVLAWARRYRLDAPILVWTAAATVEAWARGLPPDQLAGAKVLFMPQPTEPPPPYQPDRMSRDDYRTLIDTYMSEVELLWGASIEASGWRSQRIVRKRTRRKGVSTADPLLHYRWLALYQVAELPRSRIAERFGVDPASVREGITTLAAELGIKARAQARGRPPAQK